MAGPVVQREIAPPPVMPPHADRIDDRSDGRDEFVRVRPREPHEKYHIEDGLKTRGMDYFWAATTVRGAPNPRFAEYLRAGWKPEAAKNFPDMSGLGLKVDPRLVAMGVMPKIEDDSFVHLDGLMLLTRPMELSRRAREEESKRARGQIDDHLDALRSRSEHAIGKATKIERTYGPADEAPSDQE